MPNKGIIGRKEGSEKDTPVTNKPKKVNLLIILEIFFRHITVNHT